MKNKRKKLFNFKNYKTKLNLIKQLYKAISINLKLVGFVLQDIKFKEVDWISRINCEQALDFSNEVEKEFDLLFKDLKQSFRFYEDFSDDFEYSESYFHFLLLPRKLREFYLNKIL